MSNSSPTAPDGYAPPFVPPAWLGWTAAACFFFAALFFAGKSFNVRRELQSVLEAERLARLEAGTLKNLLEAERILSRGQLNHLATAEQLIADLRVQTDISRLKVTSLTSRTDSSPQARAIVVWDPDRQEGVLVVSKLPTVGSGQKYQLWIVDGQNPAPVNAGVVSVEPATGEARVNFKPVQPVADARSFTVTLESGDTATRTEGPTVLGSD